jgi:phosphoribosylglycinamide formyltransferase 1
MLHVRSRLFRRSCQIVCALAGGSLSFSYPAINAVAKNLNFDLVWVRNAITIWGTLLDPHLQSFMTDTPSLISPTPTTITHARSPLILGIMASGSGSNFEAVARSISSGNLNAKIAVLIHNKPGIKAIERAQQHGIPTVFLDHRNYSTREELDRAIVSTFQSHQVECVVMAGWMRVITQVLIDAFPDRIINIHPSLLPSFPGIHAIEQALAAKVKITGCTVHLVSLEVDAGPILVQSAVPVLANDTAETLHARVQIQEHLILPQAIDLLAQQLSLLQLGR